MNTFLHRRILSTIVLVLGLLFATQSYGATNVTISTAATSNMTYAAGVYTPVAGAANAIVNVSQLQSRLASTNVSISTASTGPSAGSITVSTAVSWSSGYGLTLNANGNLTVNASISNGGTGAITLQAAQGVDGLLTLATGYTLTTAGGTVTLTAGTATYKGSLSILGSITSTGGNITIANTLAGGDGSISGGMGVNVATGTVNAGAGNISITGYGRYGGTNCEGIKFGSGGTIQTTTGSITAYGTGGLGSNYGLGVLFENYNVFSTSGAISITGQGAGSIDRADGILFWGGGITTKIYSSSGDINLTAKASATSANANAFETDNVNGSGSDCTVYIGYDGTSTGTTGNITFKADAAGTNGTYLWRNSGIFKVKGQGNLAMLSASSAGTNAMTLSGVIQGTARQDWRPVYRGHYP